MIMQYLLDFLLEMNSGLEATNTTNPSSNIHVRPWFLVCLMTDTSKYWAVTQECAANMLLLHRRGLGIMAVLPNDSPMQTLQVSC